MEDIKRALINSLDSAIKESLGGYSSPLTAWIKEVSQEYESDIKGIIRQSFASAVDSDGFKNEIKKAANEKLARVLISKMGGEIEKTVNSLKSNPETRAKITVAISNVIDELGEGSQ